MDIFFSSGTISGGQYISRGVQQILEANLSTLGRDCFFYLLQYLKVVLLLPNGTELTMLITNVETDAQGKKKPGNETLIEQVYGFRYGK